MDWGCRKLLEAPPGTWGPTPSYGLRPTHLSGKCLEPLPPKFPPGKMRTNSRRSDPPKKQKQKKHRSGATSGTLPEIPGAATARLRGACRVPSGTSAAPGPLSGPATERTQVSSTVDVLSSGENTPRTGGGRAARLGPRGTWGLPNVAEVAVGTTDTGRGGSGTPL